MHPSLTSIPSPERPSWETTEDYGVRFDLVPSPSALLVSFGGVWTTNARPGFEFVSSARDLPGSTLFLTDIDQVWYQKGVRGVGPSIEAVASHLRGVIETHGFDRVVMIGNSAGGYAALLFGVLVGADEVHAFSPQTELLDLRNGYFLDKLAAAQKAAASEVWLDLRRALTERRPPARRVEPNLFLHFSRYCRKDRHHAFRMRGVDGLHVIPYHNATHGLASALRNAGLLTPLLTHSLNGTRYDLAGAAEQARWLWWSELSRRVRHYLPASLQP
jgi:pimeloyl-ACP methyl ester carboxylesterase